MADPTVITWFWAELVRLVVVPLTVLLCQLPRASRLQLSVTPAVPVMAVAVPFSVPRANVVSRFRPS